MEKLYNVRGITCAGCAHNIHKVLAEQPGVHSVEVTVDPPRARISSDTTIDVDSLNQALSSVGKYKLHTNRQTQAKPKWSYFPILLIFGFILGTVALVQLHLPQPDLTLAMRHFMGGFFLVFAFFKLLDLPGFANTFSRYDLIARRWSGYGYIYPFIELLLAIAYLGPFMNRTVLWITLVVMLFSTSGVIQALMKKDQIQCACLGTVFNLPMSSVTLVEDSLMVVMAGIMLFL